MLVLAATPLLAALALAGPAAAEFAEPTGSPFMVGNSPQTVESADFNGDGRLDLAVANANSNTVTILLGQAAGGFAPEAGSPGWQAARRPSRSTTSTATAGRISPSRAATGRSRSCCARRWAGSPRRACR